MKNFITCDLMGRMGNQMFQIASAIATAKKYGIDYFIPNETASPNTWDYYFKDKFPQVPTNYRQLLKDCHKESQDFTFEEIIYKGENMVLHGYFQSEKYFIDYESDIRQAFSFLQTDCPKFENTVSIHIRRGDYLELQDKHPTVNHSYISKAIKYFTDKGDYKFMVISDDINWCMEYFQDNYNLDVSFAFNVTQNTEDVIKDMRRMINCEHNIISNSSFSWWGAWLNNNPNKIVISPSKNNWFGTGNSHLKTENIIPKSWLQIEY